MNVNKWRLHWLYPLYDFIYLFGFFVYWRLNTWGKDPTLGCSPSLCLNAYFSPFNFWCSFFKKGINKHNKLPSIHFPAMPVVSANLSCPGVDWVWYQQSSSLWTLLVWCVFFHLLPLTTLGLFLFLFFFKAESHTTAQIVLKLTTMLLSQPPKCWKYKSQSMSLKIVRTLFSLFASRVQHCEGFVF